jgi:hypothetical protein
VARLRSKDRAVAPGLRRKSRAAARRGGPSPRSGTARRMPMLLVGLSSGFDPRVPDSAARRGSNLGPARVGGAAALRRSADGACGPPRRKWSWGALRVLGGVASASRGVPRSPAAPRQAGASGRGAPEPVEGELRWGPFPQQRRRQGSPRGSPWCAGEEACSPGLGLRRSSAGAGAANPGQATSAPRRPDPARVGRSGPTRAQRRSPSETSRPSM